MSPFFGEDVHGHFSHGLYQDELSPYVHGPHGHSQRPGFPSYFQSFDNPGGIGLHSSLHHMSDHGHIQPFTNSNTIPPPLTSPTSATSSNYSPNGTHLSPLTPRMTIPVSPTIVAPQQISPNLLQGTLAPMQVRWRCLFFL